MDVRNCAHCGRLFRFLGRAVCPQCNEAEQEQFRQVRDYLHRNRGHGLAQIEAGTGVSAAKVLKWLKEGLLEIEPGQVEGLVCERCGKSVASGRYCSACQTALSRSFQAARQQTVSQAAPPPPAQTKPQDDAAGRGHDWSRRRGRS